MTKAVDIYSDTIEFQQYRNRSCHKYETYSLNRYACIRRECRRVQNVRDRLTYYDNKNTGCPATLAVYSYQNDPAIYIHAKNKHNHGASHQYMTLNRTTRESLRQELRSNHSNATQILLNTAQSMDFTSDDKDARMNARICMDTPRSQMLGGIELSRIRSGILREKYQLHENENLSVNAWIAALGDRVLHYRLKVGSTTAFQLSLVSFLGIDKLDDYQGNPGRMQEAPISIDATFNVTKDPRMLLYTIVGRDSNGHGVPLAHLLTDSKSADIIQVWLMQLRHRFPSWLPSMILTDTAAEQIKAVKAVFPDTKMWLCSWHVYETFKREFRGVVTRKRDAENQYTHVQHRLLPALYTLLHESSISKFKAFLGEFESLLDAWPSNPNVLHRDDDTRKIAFLRKHYLRDNSRHPPTEWAQCYREDNWGGKQMDTTMLSESYHNVLKNTLFQNKRRNNRMDYVIYILMVESVNWYALRLKNQASGRDRSSTKDVRTLNQAAFERSLGISDVNIYWITDTKCCVRGSSAVSYHVSLPPPGKDDQLIDCECSCGDYIHRSKRSKSAVCKHIWASLRSRENNAQDAANIELAKISQELATAYGLGAWDDDLGEFVNIKKEHDIEGSSDAEEDYADSWEHDAAAELPIVDLSQPATMQHTGSTGSTMNAINQINDLPNDLLQHGFHSAQIDTIIRLINTHMDGKAITPSTPITSGNKRNRLCDTETSRNMRPKLTGKKRNATLGMSLGELAKLTTYIGATPPTVVID